MSLVTSSGSSSQCVPPTWNPSNTVWPRSHNRRSVDSKFRTYPECRITNRIFTATATPNESWPAQRASASRSSALDEHQLFGAHVPRLECVGVFEVLDHSFGHARALLGSVVIDDDHSPRRHAPAEVLE